MRILFLLFLLFPLYAHAQSSGLDCEYVEKVYRQCKDSPACDVSRGHQKNLATCQTQSGTQTPPSSPSVVTPVPDAKDKLKEIQALLTQNGFDTKGVDGVFGKNTCAAIASFSQKVQTPFPCGYSVGLRDALIANLVLPKDVPTKDEPKNDSDTCQQIAGWVENGQLESLWREMASERLAGLQEHKQLLLSNEAELKRYEDSTSGILAAVSEALATVSGTAKVAAGAGFSASIAGKNKEGLAFFGGVYVSLTTGEDLGKVIREVYDGELVSAADSVLRFQTLAERRIKNAIGAVTAIAEGTTDIAKVIVNKKRQRTAVREIRHQSLLMRKAIEETEQKIDSSQIYLELLSHLTELKSQCGNIKKVLP